MFYLRYDINSGFSFIFRTLTLRLLFKINTTDGIPETTAYQVTRKNRFTFSEEKEEVTFLQRDNII